MNKFFSWIALILWMALIYYFSHQPANVSNELSSGISEKILEIIEKIIHALDSEMESMNHLVRKIAHFFLYMVLGIFVANALRTSGLKGNHRIGFALLICILYAIVDEFHQFFVKGRTSQVKDVLIDSVGAITGICFYYLIGWIMKKKD